MGESLRLEPAGSDAQATPTAAASFAAYFEQEKAGLYSALCLVTRNRQEAQDLTQDAFIRLLERWDRVGTLADPRGYLYRTAMNAFRRGARRALGAPASRRGPHGPPRVPLRGGRVDARHPRLDAPACTSREPTRT